MDYYNPFAKRAAEYVRDDADFLSLVTPYTLDFIIKKYADDGVLFDRLVQIIGTPGSGKTTIARLIKFSTINKLIALQSRNKGLRPLMKTLQDCKILDGNRPKILACRIPMESGYRSFWELPYANDIKSRLMFALIESRTVLGWLNEIEKSHIDFNSISFIPHTDACASIDSIGGLDPLELRAKARSIEAMIYKISAALMPPAYEEIEKSVSNLAYRPLDVISEIRIKDGNKVFSTLPLVIFDDAHSLHPDQFSAFQSWLIRRELSVARWIMSRLDALSPIELLSPSKEHGVSQPREITTISFQKETNDRRTFNKIAQAMADRYLRRMTIFRGVETLSELLDTKQYHLNEGQLQGLEKKVINIKNKYNVPDSHLNQMKNQVARDFSRLIEPENKDDLLATFSILFERYAKRFPHQLSLLTTNNDINYDRIPEVTSGVIEGARVHLMDKFNRPLYFGINDLCLASSDNAEQFLQLASELVSLAEAKAIRKNNAVLDSKLQNNMLRKQATKIIETWNFPHCNEVKNLVFHIAKECKKKSLEGNAPLNGGAIAIGIEQSQFNTIPSAHKELAKILKYAVAYNALSIIPNHKTKNKIWCLLELNGVLLLHFGLTLHKGGFLERNIAYLNNILGI